MRIASALICQSVTVWSWWCFVPTDCCNI